MFTDARSKRVILVAHCILNQNAISDGTAAFPGMDEAVVRRILASGAGILQLPCPEVRCLGLDRGDEKGGLHPVLEENTRIRQALEEPTAAHRLSELTEAVVREIEDYQRHDFHVLGIVGIDRSPSCGVNTTSQGNQEVPGRGCFMDALQVALARRGLALHCIGIKASQPDVALARIDTLLMGDV